MTRASGKRGWLALLALLAALSMLAAGCGDDDDGGEGGGGGDGGSSSDNSPYKIGFAASLSGFLGPTDSEVLKGVKFRVDQLNAEGGIDGKHKITLAVENSASDPAKARQATTSLISDGSQFLILPCAGDIALPGALLAQEKQIPSIASCAGDSNFPKKAGNFAFLSNPGGLAQGAALAEYALDNDLKSAYIVGSDQNVYVTAITRGFKEQFERNGGKVVGEDNVRLFQQSYAPAVQKVKNSGQSADVIMTPLFAPDSVAFLRQLRSAGVDTPVLLDDGNDTPLLFSTGDPGDVIVATFGFPTPGTELATFYDAYEQKTGKVPQSNLIGLGADIVDLIDAAVTKAGTTDPVKVRDALDSLEDQQVRTGTVSYAGGEGLQQRAFVLIKPTGSGKAFEKVTEITPTDPPQP